MKKRKLKKPKTLKVNAIICMGCRDILVSWFRNDLKVCSCELQVFIDGGQDDYVRVGALDPTAILHAKLIIEVPWDEEQTIS